ncbi:hypothetical protein RMATCC62417_00129 [Rhizopus microsporus]|nr:hypothetical protein RMATCC62417_00129 [Rhizopus microsporus]
MYILIPFYKKMPCIRQMFLCLYLFLLSSNLKSVYQLLVSKKKKKFFLLCSIQLLTNTRKRMKDGGTNSFINYVKKQPSVDLIVISSDEEDNGNNLSKQPQEEQQQEQPDIKQNDTEYIVVDDSDEEHMSKDTMQNLDNIDFEEMFEQQRKEFLAALDEMSKAFSLDDEPDVDTVNTKEDVVDTEGNMYVKPMELDECALATDSLVAPMQLDTPLTLPSSSSDLYNTSSIPNIVSNIPTNTIRINVQSQPSITSDKQNIIPGDLDTEEYLNMLDMYLFALSETSIPSSQSSSVLRTASRRATRSLESHSNEAASRGSGADMQKLYVPNKVWFNSTWEDWAQLDPGDVLHIPFSKKEIEVLEYYVNKRMVRGSRSQVDFWLFVSSMLPGRTGLDCKWFWIDYTSNIPFIYTRPVMIRRFKRASPYKSRYSLIQQRKRSGYLVRHVAKQLCWEDMSKESVISGGSGDAISVAVFKDDFAGVRVAVGSLCDENVQYNMPGNLRLWNSLSKTTHTLLGHQTIDTNQTQQQQTIWRTVADVKASNEGGLFFSGSHDGTTKVWKQSSGRLVSTLQYHCKPVNQLAVNYWTAGNMLASCSNDGTATIWRIGSSGKTGQGSICELDEPFYRNPAVECLEFGHHATHNLLFLGIYNREIEHTGYIQTFDTETCQPVRHYDSMNGGVAAMNVSSSGRFIASGNYNRYDNLSGDKHLHLHDVRLDKPVEKFYTGHHDVNVVSISPCEMYVASGNAEKEKGEVVIFDVRFHTRFLHKLLHDHESNIDCT